jgi:N4-(beta-N-acetylglucosaminyl)-L-asparaginase
VLLVGAGALQFALEQGFTKEELLTPESEHAWHEFLKSGQYRPSSAYEPSAAPGGLSRPSMASAALGLLPGGSSRPSMASAALGLLPGGKNNHDTIGMLARDAQGHLAGACTTSGLAWKLRGRVGDSPIVGAGLYVDDEVGAATSTGVGEEVIRNAGSFLVVELMRQGRSPQEACREAVRRIARRNPKTAKDIQVGFLAMNRDGEAGAWALQKGFSYAVCDAHKQDALIAAPSLY